MSESVERTGRLALYWDFLVNGWPVIAAVAVGSWMIAGIVGKVWVTEIVTSEYARLVAAEPQIVQLRSDIQALDAKLGEVDGNVGETREQLATVITRLDTLISIRLQERP